MQERIIFWITDARTGKEYGRARNSEKSAQRRADGLNTIHGIGTYIVRAARVVENQGGSSEGQIDPMAEAMDLTRKAHGLSTRHPEDSKAWTAAEALENANAHGEAREAWTALIAGPESDRFAHFLATAHNDHEDYWLQVAQEV